MVNEIDQFDFIGIGVSVLKSFLNSFFFMKMNAAKQKSYGKKTDIRHNDGDINDQLKRPGIHDQRSGTNNENQAKPLHLITSKVSYKQQNTKKENGDHELLSCSLSYNINNSNKSNDPMKHSKNCLLFVTLLIVVLGIAFECLFPPLIAEERSYWRLNNSLTNLKKNFPNQSERFWQTVLYAVKPILLPKLPSKPAVILLAGAKRSETFSQCLAERLFEAVRVAFEVENSSVIFDCRLYKNFTAYEVVHELNNSLSRLFKTDAKVGLVLAAELLPGNSSTIFYRFCNPVNARSKKLFIINFNMEEEAMSEKDEAQNELRQMWEPSLERDQVDALFSCIGKSVAYVRDEKSPLICNKVKNT